MNTQTEPLNPMQSTEALPLEGVSLPAEEVLIAQQSGMADLPNTASIFIP